MLVERMTAGSGSTGRALLAGTEGNGSSESTTGSSEGTV